MNGIYLDTSVISSHDPYEPSFFYDEESHPGKHFWTWGIFNILRDPTEAELDDLQANGWEPWNDGTRPFFFPLQLQLGQTLIVGPSYWARTLDIQFAQQYPVLLTYQTAAQEEEEYAHFVPPDMQFGTCALIADDITNISTFSLYTSDQLGAEGQRLCEQIKSGMLIPLTDYHYETSWKERYILSQKRHALWEDTHRAAQELAKLYWHLHQETRLTTQGDRSLPETLYHLKTPALTAMPSLVHSVLNAYSNAQSGADQWKLVDRGYIYQYQRANDRTEIQLRPHDTEIVDETMLQSLWERIQSISDLDGDVFLCLLAQWMAAPRDAQGFVWITAEQILDYRGIRPRMQHVIPSDKTSPMRRAGHRQENLVEIAASISRIRDTHVSMRQWITEPSRSKRGKGRPKKQLFQEASYLMVIADTVLQREIEWNRTSEATPATNPSLSIAWRYQPGGWQEIFLDGPNRQIAWLIQRALNYDRYHEVFEKRLARYFMFHMGTRLTGTATTCKIGDILKELSLPINWSDPEKTRTRFEKAMHRLQSDQQITEWEMAKDYGPLPRRHWLNTWLNYDIRVFTAPLLLKKETDEQNKQREVSKTPN